jgi:hypothetical protein
VYSNPSINQTAVLGIFMQVFFSYNETQSNTVRFYDEDTRKEWKRFFDVLKTLRVENNTIILDLNLALLMGETLQDFWRYQGSLTTPPCTENVIWTIFTEPIMFVESEFKSLRDNIYFEDYRSPQPLYTRIIYRNFFNESLLSSVPDYNCCPRKDLNQLSNKSISSYCPLYLIFLVIFSYLFIIF